MENKNKIIKTDMYVFRDKQDKIFEHINIIEKLIDEYKTLEDNTRKSQIYTPLDVMHLAQEDLEFEKEHQVFINNHKIINNIYDTIRKI